MVTLVQILNSIKVSKQYQEAKDIKDKIKRRYLERQRVVSDSEVHLIERIKRDRTYCFRPHVLQDSVSDPYALELVITQIKRRYEEESSPILDIGKIKDNYQVFLNDNTIVNPFIISKELVRIIKRLTKYMSDDEQKAMAIFDWMEANIEYGGSKRLYGYSNTAEVLENKQGVCGEMALLYITMARSVSLRSSYVSVKRDYTGEKVNHACAIVDVGHREIFVDPAYHTFDIDHKEVSILTDTQVIEKFNEWR